MLFVLKLLFYFVLFICKNKAFYLKNTTQTLENRTLISFLLRIVHIIQEKQPVLAIETDGYSYHNDETEQHQRDMMKDGSSDKVRGIPTQIYQRYMIDFP